MSNYTRPELVQPTADIMLRIAATEKTITYGNAADIIGAQRGHKIFDIHMGWAVGAMMDQMLKVRPDAPPLNALMVSAKWQEPSEGADGFISRWLGEDFTVLSDKRRKRALADAFRAAWSFDDWNSVYEETFGVTPLKIETGVARDFSAGEYGGPAESEEHRNLRLAVTENPSAFLDIDGQISAATEKRLLSGDEIDVHVTDDYADYAVEVKSRRSNDADLERGIYQAVKYRAVLKAQYKAVHTRPKVKAVLISERKLTKPLNMLARELKVDFIFTGENWQKY